MKKTIFPAICVAAVTIAITTAGCVSSRGGGFDYDVPIAGFDTVDAFREEKNIVCHGIDYVNENELAVPTGRADGETANFLLYVNGNMYAEVKTYSYLTSLPEGYVKCGEVKLQDPRSIPSEDFDATDLAVGTQVFASPDNVTYVYAEVTAGRFAPYVLYTDEVQFSAGCFPAGTNADT